METRTHSAGRLSRSIKRQQRFGRSVITLPRAGRWPQAEHVRWPWAAHLVRDAAANRADAVRREIFQRKIDAIAARILCHVAQNVGELEGDARLFGQLLGARIGVAEDPDANQTHDRGHQITVAIEIGEGGVRVGSVRRGLIEVHGYAGDQFIQKFEWNMEARGASRTARKAGSTVEPPLADTAPLGQPASQAAAAFVAGEGFVVGQIVGLAHEGVDGADGIAARGWQRDKSVIEVLCLASGDDAAGSVSLGQGKFVRWG